MSGSGSVVDVVIEAAVDVVSSAGGKASATGVNASLSDVSSSATTPAGGSAWNRGGWHWENRDVSALASAALHDGAAQLTRSGALGANARGGYVHVSVRRIERPKIEAAIQVRRGARAAIFDISFICVWEAEWEQPGKPTRALIARGDLEASHVGPDDVAGEFPLSFRVTKTPDSPPPPLQAAVRAAEGVAQQHLAALVRELVRRLPAFLLVADAAAAQRAAETGKTEAAAEVVARQEGRAPLVIPVAPPIQPAPGATAKSLAAAAASLAAEASAGAVALPVAAHRAPSAGEAPEAIPSSWNRGGWGYEHKNMKAWTQARLRQLLLGFAVDVPCAHVAIVEVEDLTGDADIVLQKVRMWLA